MRPERRHPLSKRFRFVGFYKSELFLVVRHLRIEKFITGIYVSMIFIDCIAVRLLFRVGFILLVFLKQTGGARTFP